MIRKLHISIEISYLFFVNANIINKNNYDDYGIFYLDSSSKNIIGLVTFQLFRVLGDALKIVANF